ncbi:MAG: hypothetical protein NT069_00735 [Planctomycetota bacterium]|nr:hypothetical protein [Planctomycetota bacterium]
MRMPSWKSLVNGLLLAALFGPAVAFDKPAKAQDAVYPGGSVPSGQYAGPPPGAYAEGYDPSMGAPPGGYQMPGPPPAVGPDGIPPTAWPGTSPFNVQTRERTMNKDGLWEYDNYTGPRRKYKFGIDYLMGWGVKPGPDLLIGDPNAYLHSYPTDDTFPIPPFDRLTNADFADPQPFQEWPARRLNGFGDLDHFGVRSTFGWENYDHSELQISGWVLFNNKVSLTGFGQTPNDSTDIDPYVFRLPLANGSTTGTVISYDGQLLLQYDQLMYGADFDYWATPFYEGKNVMLRMEMGVKYAYIQEKFLMQASDSGQEYQYTGDDGTITPVVPILNLAQPIDPFTTTIASRVTSNLVGPMIGVRADLGGDAFKVWGTLKTGALANIERSEVFGNNVRDQVGQSIFGPGPATTRSREHVYVTPVFETAIAGEFGFFSYLPVLKQIPILNLSKLRIGYNYTIIGSLSRPGQVIQYNYDVPDLKTKRQNFGFSSVNFGLNWTF